MLFYEGSLTHQPCTEEALWAMHTKPMVIARRQIQYLYELSGNKFNNREIMPLQGRNITRFPNRGDSSEFLSLLVSAPVPF